MPTPPQLEWKWGILGAEPKWTQVPSIDEVEKIARRILIIPGDARCVVEPFGLSFELVRNYKVMTKGGSYTIRVLLPVDPHVKTESSVTTMNFVRKLTTIGIPEILHYEADSNNDLQFEWTLAKSLPGTSLRLKWRTLSMDTKRHITVQLARLCASLYRGRFDSIGSLYPHDDAGQDVRPWHMVSYQLYADKRRDDDVPHGPFKTDHDWLRTYLQLEINDQLRRIEEEGENPEDPEEKEEAVQCLEICKRLQNLLPTVFPPSQPTSTCLFPEFLEMEDVLIDDEGTITGITQWDEVAAVPQWYACQLPILLISHRGRRDIEPHRDMYAEYNPDVESEATADLDAEGKNVLFWEHLLEYEQTMLEQVFLDEMRLLLPEWVEMRQDSQLKLDFYKAIVYAGKTFSWFKVRDWVSKLGNGEEARLFPKMDLCEGMMQYPEWLEWQAKQRPSS